MSYHTLRDLQHQYALEGIEMTLTIEEYREASRRRFVEELSIDERLAGLSAGERLAGLTPEEIRAYLQRLEQSDAADANGRGEDPGGQSA